MPVLDLIFKSRSQFKKQPLALWKDSREEFLDHLRRTHTSIYFCVGEISQILEISDQKTLARCIVELFNALNELLESNNHYLESKLHHYKKLQEREKEIVKKEKDIKRFKLRNKHISVEVSAQKEMTKTEYKNFKKRFMNEKELEIFQAKDQALERFMRNGFEFDPETLEFMEESERMRLMEKEEKKFKKKVDKCLQAIENFNNTKYLDMMFEPRVIVEVSKQVYEKMIKRSKVNIKELTKTVDRLAGLGQVQPNGVRALDNLIDSIKANTPELEFFSSSKNSIYLRKKYVDDVLRSTENSLKECFKRNNNKIALKAIRAYIDIVEMNKTSSSTQTAPNKQLKNLSTQLKKIKKESAEKEKYLKDLLAKENHRYAELEEKGKLEIKMKSDLVNDLNRKLMQVNNQLHTANLKIEKLNEDITKAKTDKILSDDLVSKTEGDLNSIVLHSNKLGGLLGSINFNLKEIVESNEGKTKAINLNFEGMKNLSENIGQFWRFINKMSQRQFNSNKIPDFDYLSKFWKRIKQVKLSYKSNLVDATVPPEASKNPNNPNKEKKKRRRRKGRKLGSQENLAYGDSSLISDNDEVNNGKDRLRGLNTSLGMEEIRESISGRKMNKTMNKIQDKNNPRKRWTIGPQTNLHSKISKKFKENGNIQGKEDIKDILSDDLNRTTFTTMNKLETAERLETQNPKVDESPLKSRGSRPEISKSSKKLGKILKNGKFEVINKQEERAKQNEQRLNSQGSIRSGLNSKNQNKASKDSDSDWLSYQENQRINSLSSPRKKSTVILEHIDEKESSEDEISIDSDGEVHRQPNEERDYNKPSLTHYLSKHTQTAYERSLKQNPYTNPMPSNSNAFSKNQNNLFQESDGFKIPKKYLISKDSERNQTTELESDDLKDVDREALEYIKKAIEVMNINENTKKMIQKLFGFILDGHGEINQILERQKSHRALEDGSMQTSQSNLFTSKNYQSLAKTGVKNNVNYNFNDKTYRNKYSLRNKNMSMNEAELLQMKRANDKLPSLMHNNRVQNSTDYVSNGSRKSNWRYKSYDANLPSDDASTTYLKKTSFLERKNSRSLLNGLQKSSLHSNPGPQKESSYPKNETSNSVMELIQADNPKKRAKYVMNLIEADINQLSPDIGGISKKEKLDKKVNDFINSELGFTKKADYTKMQYNNDIMDFKHNKSRKMKSVKPIFQANLTGNRSYKAFKKPSKSKKETWGDSRYGNSKKRSRVGSDQFLLYPSQRVNPDGKISPSGSPKILDINLPDELELNMKTKFNPLSIKKKEGQKKLVNNIVSIFCSDQKLNLKRSSSMPEDLPPFQKIGITGIKHVKNRFARKMKLRTPDPNDPNLIKITNLRDNFKNLVNKEVKNFMKEHSECGEVCVHLKRFYERIGALFLKLQKNKGDALKMNKVNIDKITNIEDSLKWRRKKKRHYISKIIE